MTRHPAHDLARAIGDCLAHPSAVCAQQRSPDWWRQSLAHGVPGIALLHVELAAAGIAPWQRARDWLDAAVTTPVTCGPDSHPCYGAPALAHALACAAQQLPGAYTRALDVLDRQIVVDTRRRLATAHQRIDQHKLPALAEFDALQGLAGYGAYLLHRDPDGAAVRDVLDYLVRLADPVATGGEPLPGWWTASGPSGRADDRFRIGHANHGVAHGISGVLCVLALAARQGVTVHGQIEAIGTICEWLDRWRSVPGSGPAWPYWVTHAEFSTGQVTASGPARPSWCYGTAGQARAQQLAALALADTERQLMAEDALASALADPAQLAGVADSSLCHGFAGLAHLAARCAADALPPSRRKLAQLIPGLLDAVLRAGRCAPRAGDAAPAGREGGPGFLDGAAGVALAVLAPSTGALPHSAWDACLVIA